MGFLAWDEHYSVGVRTMDDQHKVLFDIVNELYHAMMKGQAQTITGPLLAKLVNYTREHFHKEEIAMKATHYPGLAAHTAKHHDLIQQVEKFGERFHRGDIMLSVDLFNFLRDWLTKHIQHDDKDYGPWMHDHGVR